MARYAVNLVAMAELTQRVEGLPLWLLLRDIVTEQVVSPDPNRPGHDALLVCSDVDGERWRAIVLLVRREFKKYEFPLYKKLRTRWRQVKVADYG